MSQLTPELRDILAEVGHMQLLLESHQTAARYCRDQMKKLRQRLMELEQAAQRDNDISQETT